MVSITLTKHHGLGNDFLIAVDPVAKLGPDDAVRWCDRRRGIGADGMIVAYPSDGQPTPGTDRWDMTLWNADGSRAELSGNGLRCLGQALVLHHDDGSASRRFEVTTDAGVRVIEVTPDRQSDTDQVTVDMGVPQPGPPGYEGWGSAGIQVHRQLGVNVGNPHLVAIVDAVDQIDLGWIGPIVEHAYDGGINLELIEIPDRSSISLRVWERGAGLTEACGSGACAAVWAARQWDLVDTRVTVTMPGGEATIDAVGDNVFLTGPATFVAVIEAEGG